MGGLIQAHSIEGIDMISIGIFHRSILVGDAIGNDILGSCDLLTKMEFDCWLLGEFVHETIKNLYQVDLNLDSNHINNKYDLIFYHHSLFWEHGGQILNDCIKPIVIKFHNITPPHFFVPYSPLYVDICRKGFDQILVFKDIFNVRLWQADSLFNMFDLRRCGIAEKHIKLVPPFNRVSVLGKKTNAASFSNQDAIQILFIGRHAPNKGHFNLLIVLAIYRTIYSERVLLKIVGSNNDPQLKKYYQEIEQLIFKLGLSDNVKIISHITDQELDDLLLSSHIYLNLSDHEGFCVPIIEAQSVGLPIVTTEVCALRETAGLNQVVLPYPITEEDFQLYAYMIHEIINNKVFREELITNGLKNVRERFSQEILENLFISSIEPILKRLV